MRIFSHHSENGLRKTLSPRFLNLNLGEAVRHFVYDKCYRYFGAGNKYCLIH